jgi:TatD DNase family protein
LFVNIHTHHPSSAGEWAIQNRYTNFETVELAGNYSIGLHPWYIEREWIFSFEKLQQYSTHPNVLAIGETGLDKVCTTGWMEQQIVFSRHIQLANEIKKPLIIHCVKAWDEVLQILKNEKVNVPVIFHGFTKQAQLAKRITDAGYYLSFGKSLQQETVQQVLASVPADQFFLETDDAAIAIQKVYEYAAKALLINSNSLRLQIQKNTAAVFGPSFML